MVVINTSTPTPLTISPFPRHGQIKPELLADVGEGTMLWFGHGTPEIGLTSHKDDVKDEDT